MSPYTRERPKILVATPIMGIYGVQTELRRIGDVHLHEDLSKADLERLFLTKSFEVLFVNPNRQRFYLSEDLIRRSGAKVIATASTGTSHIDVDYCEKAGVEVLCLAKDNIIYQIPSTAEHALALTLNMIRRIPEAVSHVRDGYWDCEEFVGEQMEDMTVGVIGYGRLGTKYAKFCDAMGATVGISDPNVGSSRFKNLELNELLGWANIVSLHVHLTEDTKNLINVSNLKLLRSDSVLINTSRGGIVDEQAVVDALYKNELGGYATDVLTDETTSQARDKNPLIDAMHDGLNIMITPHIGGMTRGARQKAYNRTVDLIKRYYGRVRVPD